MRKRMKGFSNIFWLSTRKEFGGTGETTDQYYGNYDLPFPLFSLFLFKKIMTKTVFALHNVSAVHRGCAVQWGMFSTLGGYIMSTVGDIMSTWGVFSTLGDIMSTPGIS